MNDGISIILLTWNGLELLKECLPRVIDNLSQWIIPHELIIVDNGSQDGSVEYLKSVYPDVTLIEFSENFGFAKANNEAVKHVQFETLLFLNNDLYLQENFIQPLHERLQGENVFAVAPKILRWDKMTIDDGLRYGSYYSGLFSVELEKDLRKFDKPHWVTFFCGACFLCKKKIFEKLGGFDTLYTPYAWEDLDLAYRAWKRGYKVVYEPRSIAYHKREATTRNAFSELFFISLMWKNKFIFIWKNITSRKMLISHLLWLPIKLIKFLFNGRWRYVVGFFRAVPYVPSVITSKIKERRFFIVTDEDVLKHSYKEIL